jgi:hypothetical protein
MSENVNRISKAIVLVPSERLPVAVQSAQCFFDALQSINMQL